MTTKSTTTKAASLTSARRFRVYDPMTKVLMGIVPATSTYEAAEKIAQKKGMSRFQASLFCMTAPVKMVKVVKK